MEGSGEEWGGFNEPGVSRRTKRNPARIPGFDETGYSTSGFPLPFSWVRSQISTRNPPIGEVISIGDEMTSGARLDTNAAWLSQRLTQLGVSVQFHSTVGDTIADNVDVFRIAAERADVIVCTGGLGPTRDDLTREALSQAVGSPLEFDASAMQHIEDQFARRNRKMPERNRVQALFPAGSDVVYNPQGTAPGIDLVIPTDRREARCFALPGVPAEMKRMFDDTVSQRILEISAHGTVIRQRVMKFFGVGESEMEHRLGEMISRDRWPRVGITVSEATISLRIWMAGESAVQCDKLIDRTADEITDRVAEFYFGEGEHFEQQHAIMQTLAERDESLAIVEFGCAAPLAGWFANLDNHRVYGGGISLTSRQDLSRWLPSNIDCESSDSDNPFIRLIDRTEADWLLIVDSYPKLQSDGDQPMKACDIKIEAHRADGKRDALNVSLGGHPSILHQRIAKTAMAWLRKVMQGDSA